MDRYLVCELDTGETFTFDSMDALLEKYKCVTEARVLNCIETGGSWKGLTFDIASDVPVIRHENEEEFNFDEK